MIADVGQSAPDIAINVCNQKATNTFSSTQATAVPLTPPLQLSHAERRHLPAFLDNHL